MRRPSFSIAVRCLVVLPLAVAAVAIAVPLLLLSLVADTVYTLADGMAEGIGECWRAMSTWVWGDA